MSRLREHLTTELARTIKTHGLVVWTDPDGQFRDAAPSLVPDGTRFEAFAGSWFEVRRRIEEAMSAEEPPHLVVYGPGAPADDPLAEVRAAGTEFGRRLDAVVRVALRGELTDARIEEIASQARTLEEAEAAVAGNGGADVRLISVLGHRDVARMLTAVLVGGKDAQIEAGQMWAAVAEMCAQATGALVTGTGPVLRDSLFRHLVLCDIAGATSGNLPSDLAAAYQQPDQRQRERASDVLRHLWSDARGPDIYRQLAVRADESLSLGSILTWRPGLDRAMGTPATEGVVFRHVLDSLRDGDFLVAQAIAERRLTMSVWTADPVTGWGPRWRAVQTIAQLHVAVARIAVPDTAAGMLTWYAESGHQVDRAHRKLELARTELRTFGDLEQNLTEARATYDAWLDGVLSRFTSGLERGILDLSGLLRQGEIHDRLVVTGTAQRTAYVWVDALRYELGLDLAEALRAVAADVTVHAAVAAAPTITTVGMAALLPGAAASLRIGLSGDRLAVFVGDNEVRDVAGRVKLLRAHHGTVCDLDLNDAAQKGEKALSRATGEAALVLLRSQEVDAVGESGMLSVGWSHFETVTNLLASVVARLAQSGVERVVISADHGFIALGQDLSTPRLVDPPAGAVGIVKRRVFAGRGGIPDPATVRVPLDACGVASDLDIVVPKGLAVFRAGGGRQFFHGGLSPQELVVPVIVLSLAKAPKPRGLDVSIQVAGGRITTGVFAATLQFSGDMFTNELTVRVMAMEQSGPSVARIVSGDGYDPEPGTVIVSNDRINVLTFQVTANLAARTWLELQALDARTGMRLSTAAVPVAADVIVEDSLD